MLFAEGGLGLAVFALWLFCVIDVITTPEHLCRNLPKLAWVFIVILLLDIGAIVWLVAGRPWNAQQADVPYRGNRARPPARPGAARSSPDDDEEFLAQLRARAEEQRRQAREAQQRQEREEPPGGDAPSA
jgi:hypothetical protein